jgi:hypothetical protein
MNAQRIGTESPLEQLPVSLRAFLEFERFHLYRPEFFQENVGSRQYDARYLPQNCGAFGLPCFWVKRERLHVFGEQLTANHEPRFLQVGEARQRVLVPIHPLSVERCGSILADVEAEEANCDGRCVWAVPTSSPRTFLVWPDGEPDKAAFVKVSLHADAFGDRRLGARKVARSVGLSMLFDSVSRERDLQVRHFPEPVGFVPRALPDCGVIVRSIPESLRRNQIHAVPLFALLGGVGERVPLLLSLLQQCAENPQELVDRILCRPFAKLWLDLALRQGLLLEAHAQNIMLALSPNGVPLGEFFYRDFEGLQVDWELRTVRGLPTPQSLPRSFEWYETYATWGYPHSQLIWYKLYVSLFDYLHFVLHEVEVSLQSWRERGLIGGPAVRSDELTLNFSRHLLTLLAASFGTPASEFNLYRNMKKAVTLLLRVRRDLCFR